MRCVSGCTKANKIRNEIKSELDIFSINNKTEDKKAKYKDCVHRIAEIRLTRIGKGDLGKSRKRCLDIRDQSR